MKGFISPLATLLLAASIAAAAAGSDESSSPAAKLSAALETMLSQSLENPSDMPKLLLTTGNDDWTSQLSCTADMGSQQPSLVDEATCSTTTDAKEQACIWCDATAAIGQGLCLSPDQKTMLGQFWDQICAATTNEPVTPVDPPAVTPVTPAPTPNPTPNPTDSAPAPAPDDNGLPDQMKCSVDASQNVIGDEATCVAMKDTTSTSGENCSWCKIPILAGTCITAQMKAQMSWICQSSDEKKEEKFLRGDNKPNGGGGGWMKNLDPACLTDKTSCGTKKDTKGQGCIWCETNDVFGICATLEQKDLLGITGMTCADSGADDEDAAWDVVESPVAVE